MRFSLYASIDIFTRNCIFTFSKMRKIIKYIIIYIILLALPVTFILGSSIILLLYITYALEFMFNRKGLYENGKTIIIGFARNDGTDFFTVKGYRKYYNITDNDIKKPLTAKQLNAASSKNRRITSYFYSEYIMAIKGLEIS